MPVLRSNKRRRDAGVTLLELLIVLAILALLTTLTAPRVLDMFGRAKSQGASLKMENLKGALQIFYLDIGRYPTQSESLQALLSEPEFAQNWAGPYCDPEDIVDPWGREFIYEFPGTEKAFGLLTYGRDGRPGGDKEDADVSL